MPVFLSYYRLDEQKARAIHDRLTRIHGVSTYIDVLDQEMRSASDVTGLILSRLSSCTHIMALLSSATVQSWWVPFEIGAATQNERRIVSYNASYVSREDLPGYLKLWPILRSIEDLDRFAHRYKQDRLPLEKSQRLTEAKAAAIQSANEFHRLLKFDISQP